MSDLSDFKRRVYEPEVSALKQRIATLEREREAWTESARRLQWRHDTHIRALAAEAERNDLVRAMGEIEHAEKRRLSAEGLSDSLILTLARAALAGEDA